MSGGLRGLEAAARTGSPGKPADPRGSVMRARRHGSSIAVPGPGLSPLAPRSCKTDAESDQQHLAREESAAAAAESAVADGRVIRARRFLRPAAAAITRLGLEGVLGAGVAAVEGAVAVGIDVGHAASADARRILFRIIGTRISAVAAA